MLKVIFIGDIVGKIGRQAALKAIAKWKKQYKPDLIVANAENLAHGKGVTVSILNEMQRGGIDFFTSGNHVWDKKEVYDIFADPAAPIIRPANYPDMVPGDGYRVLTIGKKKIMIVNIIGQVFFKEYFDSPFLTFDEILKEKPADVKIIIVDFHVEATAEIKCMGHYLDGQVSALLGTHTHVGTCDYQLSDKGMAYVTQVGMVGAKDSSLGLKFEPLIKKMITQLPAAHELPEKGIVEVNAIYLEIKEDGVARKIKKLYEEIEIK
ncbi:MAG TPA: TIGR00282 family metallophosphoesterase [Candidatus Bipolaricaulota bacterium]|nr:TIGR00282 family metallophosphoesterase [Candidatus Bipolaricaulota bacterium]